MDFLDVVMKERLHSLFYENFTQWMITFQNMVNLCDPNLRIFITRPYEIPMNADNEFFPDIPTSVKTVYQMSETERENYDLERKSFEAILECLPNDVASCYKTQETSFKLWKSLKNTYGSKLKGTNLEAGMKKEDANKASENKVDSEPSSCASCINLTNNINIYKEESIRLNKVFENITIENEVLRANDKNSRDKLKAIMEEKKDLKAKIFEQQEVLCDYVDLVSKLKKELFDSQTKVLNLNQKLSNFSCSSLVFDEIVQSQRYETKIEKGLAYHQVPPPKDYIHMPAPENLIDLTSILKKVDVKHVKPAVSISISKPELVKAESNSATRVEEFVEVEDITEESTIKVEKKNVKPENFIITTENDERFKNKGKAKVDIGSLKVNNVKKDFKPKSSDNSQSHVKNLKKDKLVDKLENNKCSTSTSSTLGTSTSTCSPKSACSTNVPVNRPSVYYPPPKRFEGTHWNRSHVERRSCFHCRQQGHVIRDCKLLSLDRFGRVMPRTSYFRNSFSRRVSYSPVSSYASNSPKPMARVNKVVPSRPQVQKHNIVENKSSESNLVWKPKSTNNTSMKSAEFLKYHKLIDVMIMDDIGQPKSIKAWVSHKI